MATYELTARHPRHFPDGDDYIRILKTPGFFARLFGYEPESLGFKGRNTIWHHVPSGVRAGTSMEWRITGLIEASIMRSVSIHD